MKSNISILSWKKFVVQPDGLHVQGQPEFAEWMEYGKRLHAVNQHLQMVIGDWLNYGETCYGETFAQATVLWPDMQQGTLANWKYVAGRVKNSLRNENLHYSHYAAVAPLLPWEQKKWLKEAADKNWNSQELREAIHATEEEISELPPLREALLIAISALVDLTQRSDIEPYKPLIEMAIAPLRSIMDAIAVRRIEQAEQQPALIQI